MRVWAGFSLACRRDILMVMRVVSMKCAIRQRAVRSAICAVFVVCCASAPGRAQSAGGSPSPEVQKLYAEARAAQARGDAAGAIQGYKAIVKMAPHLAPAYNNLGLLYYSQKDYAAAIPVLEQGLKIDPRMTASWALLGTCQFATGKNEEAVKSFRSALKGNPDDEQVQMLLARAEIEAGDGAEAATTLRKITARKPDNQEAWYLLGKIYMQLSQDALGKVQQINPDSALSHVISGEIMEGMQNYGGALTEFEKAVAIDPTQGGAQEHLANVYWEMGEWKEARAAFLKDLSYEPQKCSARWKAADSLVKQQADPQQALQELNEAIQQCGGLMQARVDRARVLVAQGKQTEALPDLEAAVKQSPDEPSIHFLLAQVYRSQHVPEKAAEEMRLYAQLQKSAMDKVAQRAAEVEKQKANSQ